MGACLIARQRSSRCLTAALPGGCPLIAHVVALTLPAHSPLLCEPAEPALLLLAELARQKKAKAGQLELVAVQVGQACGAQSVSHCAVTLF